ncbi:MAG: hypothetical protein ABSF26_01645 [Thermoguttaceae bacterium]|jgi:hypothetical protein
MSSTEQTARVPASGFARLAPWQARAVLAALVALVLFGLAVRPPPPKNVTTRGGKPEPGDAALYMAEIRRVHAGENYYAVAAEELVARNYPTRSLFNWRMPLPVWLVAKMPALAMGRVLLGGLALALLLMAFEVTAREEPKVYRRAMPLVLLLVGPLLPCVGDEVFVMPEVWSGVMLAISLLAYGLARPCLGAATGLWALFFRELALPYCLLAAGLALWQRRRRELLFWMVGLALWAVFYALHCWQASRLITPAALGHPGGWVQFGGTRFVLATVQCNPCLLLVPAWITVLYFAAGMLGLAGWRTTLGLRIGLTVCMYIVAFSIVGYEFNQYWGSMIAPLFCFGVVRAPVSLCELWRAASWAPVQPATA